MLAVSKHAKHERKVRCDWKPILRGRNAVSQVSCWFKKRNVVAIERSKKVLDICVELCC